MQYQDVDIIIIKGAPASGKSTTAKELAKFFPKGVRLEVDNLRSMVISINWTDQEEHINILKMSTKLIHDFYDLTYKPIIVVDTFSGDKINSYYDKLKSLNENWRISIYGLYLTEFELQKRLDIRSSDKFKDFEICEKLNTDTVKFKHKGEVLIDTTNLTAKESAKMIYENIQQGTPVPKNV